MKLLKIYVYKFYVTPTFPLLTSDLPLKEVTRVLEGDSEVGTGEAASNLLRGKEVDNGLR